MQSLSFFSSTSHSSWLVSPTDNSWHDTYKVFHCLQLSALLPPAVSIAHTELQVLLCLQLLLSLLPPQPRGAPLPPKEQNRHRHFARTLSIHYLLTHLTAFRSCCSCSVLTWQASLKTAASQLLEEDSSLCTNITNFISKSKSNLNSTTNKFVSSNKLQNGKWVEAEKCSPPMEKFCCEETTYLLLIDLENQEILKVFFLYRRCCSSSTLPITPLIHRIVAISRMSAQ